MLLYECNTFLLGKVANSDNCTCLCQAKMYANVNINIKLGPALPREHGRTSDLTRFKKLTAR